jgi:two-component system response regulator HydG
MARMEREDEELCRVCGLNPTALTFKRSARMVTRSATMQDVLKRAARFAASDAPVAVLGETGTGKEVVARILHANSPRAAKPFVAVNVAALPADLLESELFGHGKGAFTGAASARRGLFEEADGGTLFLDEIGEMPLPLQAKLLRALQDGEVRRVGENRSFAVDVRIVCATHRDLAELTRAGRFREDLYFRLKVLTLKVPPLRERREDILPLAMQFLAEQTRALDGFTPQAEALLLRYRWPGNVRELQSAVMHGAALAVGPEVAADDLPDDVRFSMVTVTSPGRGASEGLATLAEVERRHILFVLDACGGSQVEAARVLGIGRNTLWRKLREFSRNA